MSLHGDAILSRYPITQMHTLRLDQKTPVNTLCYDWMNERKMGDANHVPQKGINLGLNTAFRVDDDTPSQQRRGSRICQIATINSPNGPYRVVNCHLESKAPATCRQAQMQAIDEELKAEAKAEGDMPVIIAGDWNTTQKDGTPTTVVQELKSQLHPKNLIENAIKYTTPYGLAAEAALTGVDEFRSRELDPTHTCLFPAQDKQTCENGIFKTLTNDGFDDPSQSNERGQVGYPWSYAPDRNFGAVGRLIGTDMRLDFMMEKGVQIQDPDTLQTTRFSSELSDHVPITGLIQVTGPQSLSLKEQFRELGYDLHGDALREIPPSPSPSPSKKPGFLKKLIKKLQSL